MKQETDSLSILQLGALTILNVQDQGQPALARALGVDMQPGEDLLAALARTKAVTRDHLQAYFQALANGVGVADAHLIAAPAAGVVQ
ncbi:MAG TPA: hypothetical protein VNY05_37600 [Candidatus Acidoferrales bacterium]|jgi:hypothetical protein|nr:hypothetical protein [Candidatus Acidoferrales bacterium]